MNQFMRGVMYQLDISSRQAYAIFKSVVPMQLDLGTHTTILIREL